MGGLLRPAHTHESLTRELRPAFGANRGQGRQGLGLARESAAVPQATPEYTPPDYPDRPQFKPPESLDLRKALKAGVEAGLTTEEFNSVLGQIGVVNESEQAEALQSFEMLMADYQDELGRMTLGRGEEKEFEAGLEKKRRYGLGLAKEAREVLGAERKFGLELSKHGLDIEKHGLAKSKGIKDRNLKRQIAEQKGRIELAKGKKTGLTKIQQVKLNQDQFEYENTEMKKWEEKSELNFNATPEEKAFQRKIFGEQYRNAILGSGSTEKAGSSRQTTLNNLSTEFITQYPKATDEQVLRYMKLKTGAHGKGKEAEKLWNDLMGELDEKPKPKPKPSPREALTPGEMTAGAKKLPQAIRHFFKTLPTERHGLARRQR